MKRVAMCVLCIVFILMPYMTLADSNASNLKPAQDQPRPQSVDEKNGTSVIGTKLPLDIISTGSDQSGTLLSYKLKEELMASGTTWVEPKVSTEESFFTITFRPAIL